MFAADNKSLDKGKYVAVWKKENGTWKMYRDIWNSNMSAATTK
jgi:ketosteroid isomerase-like protein